MRGFHGRNLLHGLGKEFTVAFRTGLMLPVCCGVAFGWTGLPTKADEPTDVLYLEKLDLGKMTQEWGTPQARRSVNGRPITLNGKEYPHGIGTHARSEMLIDLKGRATRFTATAGIDDEAGKAGSATVQVWVDGKKLADTGVMRGGDRAKSLDVDLTGSQRMAIRIGNAGDGNGMDHADLADAKFLLVRDAKSKPEAIGISNDPPPIASGDPAEPAIRGPRVVGATPGKPFLFLVPVTGQRPITISANALPAGLTLDADTGNITGTVKEAGAYSVELTARNPKGVVTRKLKIVAGEGKLALTPPMGWSSWYAYELNVNEEDIRKAADWMIQSGLASHGYQYINLDDGWQGSRTESGELKPNDKFRDIKRLADHVHSKGLRFGIYSSPGPKSCGGGEGSFGHEEQDANRFAAWGADYLKYDWCSAEKVAKSEGADKFKGPFRLMGTALRRTDRDIVYSICQYGMAEAPKWAKDCGGHLWRTGEDIFPRYGSMTGLTFYLQGCEDYAGPGHWNDPDLLLPHAFNPNEQITQITLWSLLAAPLLISSKPSALSRFSIDALSNDEVIEVDQDPAGKAARRAWADESLEVWSRPLSDGTVAVGLFNLSMEEAAVTARWSDLKLAGKQPVRDLWQRKELGVFTESFNAKVPPHGAVMVKIGTPKPND